MAHNVAALFFGNLPGDVLSVTLERGDDVQLLRISVAGADSSAPTVKPASAPVTAITATRRLGRAKAISAVTAQASAQRVTRAEDSSIAWNTCVST